MPPETQAINILRAEQRGVEVCMELVASVFKTARPVHAENFDPMTRQPQLEDEVMTKLDDYKASIEREIKQIERRLKAEDEMFKAAMRKAG